MKYGKIVYPRMLASHTNCNLGDICQSIAVDLIYDEMGITPDNIIELSVDEINEYKGERLRLPINGYFRYSRDCPVFPTSSYIDPVFLAIYCTSNQYLKQKKYWSSMKSIGCRDEITAKAMEKRGYDAFLSGCITMLFPKRKFIPKSPKVFCVDAHHSIEPFIPKELKKDMVYITHDVKIDPKMDKWETIRKCTDLCHKTYNRYRDEAGLVITSRLHCAAPCIAMGIPTIVVKDGFDERYAWLDRFVHLYTPKEYKDIDWNPIPPDIEDFKMILMKWAVSRMNGENDDTSRKAIEEYYMERVGQKIHTPIQIRAYSWLAQYAPGLAGFIREKLLYRFTIAGNRNNKN